MILFFASSKPSSVLFCVLTMIENVPFLGKRKLQERKERIASAYKEWFDKIQKGSDSILAEALKSKNMVIDKKNFTSHVQDEPPYNLISIGDFNSLIAISQDNQNKVVTLF